MASLLALSRAEQKVAKQRLAWSSRAHAVTLAAGLAALFVDERVAYSIAVVALVSETSAWALRYHAYVLHGRAEEGRRRALLTDSLETSQSERLEIASLQERFSDAARRLADQYEDPRYYASSAPRGFERLQESLQESAFWSASLYRGAALRAFTVSGVIIAAVVIAFAFIIGFADADTGLTIARILILFLSFLVATDALSQALSWWTAAAEAERTYRRLTRIDSNALDAALAVFGDYSAATATRPPIPDGVYQRRREALERAWSEARIEG